MDNQYWYIMLDQNSNFIELSLFFFFFLILFQHLILDTTLHLVCMLP